MNIFEALRQDHDIQRSLLNELVDTSGDTENRKYLFEKLKKELEIHADAEERFLYIPLIKHDSTQEKARHSIAEHHEIDELIERLEATDFDSTGWLTIAKSLQHKVEHHLEEEEHEVFQMAGKALSEKEKTTLAKDYRGDMVTNR